MIISGSIDYSYSGRKRSVKKTRKTEPVFRPASGPLFKNMREDKYYPSAPMTKYKPPADVSYKREESRNHTVAIAYNKGGYMVIGKDNIKDIGK